MKVGNIFLVKESAEYMLKGEFIIVTKIISRRITYKYDDGYETYQDKNIFLQETIPLTKLMRQLV